MAFFQLNKEQKINASIDEVWEFISSPKNLKEITPDYMGFDITSQALPEKMYRGMIISYKVKPVLGIAMKWVTEITQLEEKKYFVDEQRIGPYTFWHHQHILEKTEGGVIMKDIVSYQPPFGFIGRLANSLFISKQIESIFAFRAEKLRKKFNQGFQS